MRDTCGVPIICERAGTRGYASTAAAMAFSYICIRLPHAHRGVVAGISKFLVDCPMLTGFIYCTHRFNQIIAPCCLQAEAFHPCSVRFYFGTGRSRGLELEATPAFPLLHGNCINCAQCGDCTLACKHNPGQDSGSASGTDSMQSFLIPPTLCIEGKFEVCSVSSKMSKVYKPSVYMVTFAICCERYITAQLRRDTHSSIFNYE